MAAEKPVTRTRSKSKRRKQAIVSLIKMVVIILLVVLFIWSMFSMIIESNMLKDRRNTGQSFIQITNQKA